MSTEGDDTPIRKTPGERLVERLDQRTRRRPRVGLSPAFYARFGLADPWVDTSVDADFGAVDDAFTYVSGAGWRQHMRKLALSRWWREHRAASFSSRLVGQRTAQRREAPTATARGLFGLGFGPSLSLSDLVFPQAERHREAPVEEQAGPQRSPWLSGPLHATTGVARSGWSQTPWQPTRVARPLDTASRRLALNQAAADPVQRAVAAATPASGLGSRRARTLARTVYEDVHAGDTFSTVRVRRVLRRASPTVRTVIEDALPARGARPVEVARNRMSGAAGGTRRGLQTAWYGRTPSTRALEQAAASRNQSRPSRRRVPAASPTRQTVRPTRAASPRIAASRPLSRVPLQAGGDEAPSGPQEPPPRPSWRGATRAVARMVAAEPATDGRSPDSGVFPTLGRSRRPQSPRFDNLSDAGLAERLAPWSDAPATGGRAGGSLWAASRDAAGTPWMARSVGAATPPSARPVGRGTRSGPARLPHWRPILGASDLVLPDAVVAQVQAAPAQAPVSPWADKPYTPARTVRGALSVVERRSAVAERLAGASFAGAGVAQAGGGAFQGAATAGASPEGRDAGSGVQGTAVGRTLARAFSGAAVARQAAGGFSGAALGSAQGRPWSGASTARAAAGVFTGAALGSAQGRSWSEASTAGAAAGVFTVGAETRGSWQGAAVRRSGARPWSGASTAAAATGVFAGASAVQTASGAFSGAGIGTGQAMPWTGAGTGTPLTGDFAGAGFFQTATGGFSGAGVGSARPFPWAGADTASTADQAPAAQGRTVRGTTRRTWGIPSEGTLPQRPGEGPTATPAAAVAGDKASAWSRTPYTPARVVRMVAAAAARDQGGPPVGDAAVRASERMAAVTSALSSGAGTASPVPRWSPKGPSQTLATPFAGAASSTTPAGEFAGAGVGAARARAWRGAALGSGVGAGFSGAATRRTGSGTFSGAGAWRTPEWDWLGAGAATTPRGEFTGAAVGAGFDPGFTGAALGSSLAREFSGAGVGQRGRGGFFGARTADGVSGTFAGAPHGRTGGGTFNAARRAWTAADGKVVHSSSPPRAGFRETIDGVASEHAGQNAPGWAVRATGRTFLNTTGDLVQSLAEARDPLEVIQVILDRGDRLAVSRNLPTPVVEVIRQIRATAAQESVSPRLAAQRAADAHHSPSASVIRGRRAGSMPSTTRVVRGGGRPSGPSMTGIGAAGGGKLRQLASRLQNLIQLVQVENKLSDAQRQVRMAAEGAEAAPAGGDQAAGARADAKAGDLEALKREVLTTVSRELELRRERGQEDSDGHWW